MEGGGYPIPGMFPAEKKQGTMHSSNWLGMIHPADSEKGGGVPCENAQKNLKIYRKFRIFSGGDLCYNKSYYFIKEDGKAYGWIFRYSITGRLRV